jgi:glycosyltransferase involved in cell wall biosynthesis
LPEETGIDALNGTFRMNGNRLCVAFVTHFYPSAAEQQRGLAIHQMVQSLSAMADIEVFCVSPVYPKVDFLEPRRYLYRRCVEKAPFTSLPVHFIQYPAFPLLSRPFNGSTLASRLIPELARMRFDVIVSCFAYPDGFAAVLAGEELGIPVIVETLGSDLRCAKSMWARRLVRRALGKASLVTAVSAELRERALELGVAPNRVRVMRWGCDEGVFHLADRTLARTQLNIPQDAELIVFVGRLVEIKGLRELFTALPGLVAERPAVKLACIGEGPMEQELRSRALKSGVAGRTIFVGSLDPHGVAHWLAASNLLCLPSHSEGLPSVVLEAFACGRPVVASAVGGIPEVVDPSCGILTFPKDPVSLSRALSDCLSQEWDAKLISGRFNRTWRDVARDTYNACLEVLRESGNSAAAFPAWDQTDSLRALTSIPSEDSAAPCQ